MLSQYAPAHSIKGVIHSIHYHRLVLDEAHSIKVNCSRRLPMLYVFSLTLLCSNVRLVLPRRVLPCKLLTNGVCLVLRYRIESANFSPCFVSFRSAHLHVISVSNAIASSFSGLQTNRAVVRNAITRMYQMREPVYLSLLTSLGVSIISRFSTRKSSIQVRWHPTYSPLANTNPDI